MHTKTSAARSSLCTQFVEPCLTNKSTLRCYLSLLTISIQKNMLLIVSFQIYSWSKNADLYCTSLFPSRPHHKVWLDKNTSLSIIWKFILHLIKTHFFLRIQLIFHFELLLMWLHHTWPTKSVQGKYRHAWAWPGIPNHTQPASAVLLATFPWLLALCQKF